MYPLDDIADFKGYFSIKNSFEDTNYVKQKEHFAHSDTDLPNGILHFKIDPLDTSNLEIKKYFAEISLESDSDLTIRHTILSFDLYFSTDIKND